MFIKDPMEIEKKSFEIIKEEFGPHDFSEEEWQVVRRVIHTTADFEYGKRICFQNDGVEKGIRILSKPCKIYCDTKMVVSGINKKALKFLGHDAFTLVSDEKVTELAQKTGDTRSKVAMDMAVREYGCNVYVVGNAPTALLELHQKMQEGFHPDLVIGVPVGFVGAEESKDLFLGTKVPCILVRGRKGGSSVAASIVNALMYQIQGTR